MSEERVIYTEVNFSHLEKQKDHSDSGQKRRGFPWRILAVYPSILSFLLLVAVTGLGYMFFQSNIQDLERTKETNISSQEIHNHSVISSSAGQFHSSCQRRWSCCGEKCYYFLKEKKTWIDSKKACEDMDFSLIKIDNKHEQHFIQARIRFNHWVGLNREGNNLHWKWQNDGSELSKILDIQLSTKSAEKCGYIKSTAIMNDVCIRKHYYICEWKVFCLPN